MPRKPSLASLQICALSRPLPTATLGIVMLLCTCIPSPAPLCQSSSPLLSPAPPLSSPAPPLSSPFSPLSVQLPAFLVWLPSVSPAPLCQSIPPHSAQLPSRSPAPPPPSLVPFLTRAASLPPSLSGDVLNKPPSQPPSQCFQGTPPKGPVTTLLICLYPPNSNSF